MLLLRKTLFEKPIAYPVKNTLLFVLFMLALVLIPPASDHMAPVLVVALAPVLIIRCTLSEAEYRQIAPPMLAVMEILFGGVLWALLEAVQRHNFVGY